MIFIENVGQFDEHASFQAQVAGGPVYLTEEAIWFTLLEQPSAGPSAQRLTRPLGTSAQEGEKRPGLGVNLKLTFPGANPHPRLEPFDRLDTPVSYFRGDDPDQWRAKVPVWGGVRYKDLYPGVDLEMTSVGGRLALLTILEPGADLEGVRLRVEGADEMAVNWNALHLASRAGNFTLPLLQAFTAGGVAIEPSDGPKLSGREVISPFAASRPFAINPSLATDSSDLLYGTFLGGTSYEWGNDIVVDGSGAAYITGWTGSANFPTIPGAFDTSLGDDDAFVVKVNPSGNGLAYATFLGGASYDEGLNIAVDGSGAAYVTGRTESTNFPTTPGAFDPAHNGGYQDGFVVKVSPSGLTLVYATFLGGAGSDYGRGLAIDGSGAAYVTGDTTSSDFPSTPGAIDTTMSGSDAFVVKVNPTGSTLAYATFLGGNDYDSGKGIAVDESGAAYVTGDTTSTNFPFTSGAFDPSFNDPEFVGSDAFVVKLNPSGTALAYATFLGGSDDDACSSIAVDLFGAAYVTGRTWSADFPTTPGAFDTAYNGYNADPFVVKVNASGAALTYATFIGGGSDDYGSGIAVDRSGAAYVTGRTVSADFPTTPGAFDAAHSGNWDAFVVRLSPGGLIVLDKKVYLPVVLRAWEGW